MSSRALACALSADKSRGEIIIQSDTLRTTWVESIINTWPDINNLKKMSILIDTSGAE
jgi:hypothetical protein